MEIEEVERKRKGQTRQYEYDSAYLRSVYSSWSNRRSYIGISMAKPQSPKRRSSPQGSYVGYVCSPPGDTVGCVKLLAVNGTRQYTSPYSNGSTLSARNFHRPVYYHKPDPYQDAPLIKTMLVNLSGMGPQTRMNFLKYLFDNAHLHQWCKGGRKKKLFIGAADVGVK